MIAWWAELCRHTERSVTSVQSVQLRFNQLHYDSTADSNRREERKFALSRVETNDELDKSDRFT
jgi:hypothetical protein